MEIFYLVCLLISIGMLVWLKIVDVRNSIAQYLNLIIVIVSSFGYFFFLFIFSIDSFLKDLIESSR